MRVWQNACSGPIITVVRRCHHRPFRLDWDPHAGRGACRGRAPAPGVRDYLANDRSGAQSCFNAYTLFSRSGIRTFTHAKSPRHSVSAPRLARASAHPQRKHPYLWRSCAQTRNVCPGDRRRLPGKSATHRGAVPPGCRRRWRGRFHGPVPRARLGHQIVAALSRSTDSRT